MTYFLDANILSYVLKNVPSVIKRLSDLIKNGDEIKIPAIAYYEVKRGLLANNCIERAAKPLKKVVLRKRNYLF